MVDIRTIDLIYLHGPHRPERKEHMERHLSEKGLTAECHVGVSDKGHQSGVLGMIAIMRKRLEGEFKPFILLEDDCSPTEWFRYEVPVPGDADAVYIGLSIYGLHPQGDFGIPQIEYVTVNGQPELVRILNMLSNHAIMFVTKQWTENCLVCFEKMLSAQDPRAYDIEQCRTMKNFNVYALRRPLYFQDAKVGGQQDPTLVNIIQVANLFDKEFAHAREMHGCDACGVLPASKIQYVRDRMVWDGVTLFTDNCILYVDSVQSRVKIAWIIEPPVIRDVWYQNQAYLESKFDYILTYDQRLIDKNPQKYLKYHLSSVRIPKPERMIYNKTKLLSLVLSSKKYAIGHSLRHQIAEKHGYLMDVYGDKYIPYADCLVAYKDYAFVIVTMNCKMNYFFAEYLTHAFVTGAVPIFWGCSGVGEIFNPKGIIEFDTLDDLSRILPTLTFELYESMKPYVLENFEKAKNYISADDSVADAIIHLNNSLTISGVTN